MYCICKVPLNIPIYLNFLPLFTNLQMPQPFLSLHKRISNKLHFLIYADPFTQKKDIAILLDGRCQELLNPTDSLVNYEEPHRNNNKLEMG